MTTRLSPTVRALVEAEHEIAKLQKLLDSRACSDHASQTEYVAKACGLTLRETEVFALVIEGQCNAEASVSLAVSKATIKWHMHNIFVKTGAGCREGLVRLVAGLPPLTTGEIPRRTETAITPDGFAVCGAKGSWAVHPYTLIRGSKREYGEPVAGPFKRKRDAEKNAVKQFQSQAL